MEKQYLLTESELRELLEDRLTLAALEAAGVDNWIGYDIAFEDEEQDENCTVDDMLKNYEEFC